MHNVYFPLKEGEADSLAAYARIAIRVILRKQSKILLRQISHVQNSFHDFCRLRCVLGSCFKVVLKS